MESLKKNCKYLVVLFFLTTLFFAFLWLKEQKRMVPKSKKKVYTFIKPDSQGRTFAQAQNEAQEYAADPLPIIASNGEYVRHFHIPAGFINTITSHPQYLHGIRVYLVKEGGEYNFLLAGVDANDNNIIVGNGAELPMVNKNDPCPDMCVNFSDRSTDLNYSMVTHGGVDKQAWCFPTATGIEWRDATGAKLTGTVKPIKP
jgi:hypothetical protein